MAHKPAVESKTGLRKMEKVVVIQKQLDVACLPQTENTSNLYFFLN